jgi:hypothetical protein
MWRRRVYDILASPSLFPHNKEKVVEISYSYLSPGGSLHFDNESLVVSIQLHLIDTDI